MKALVTGGCGFIGSHLTDFLVSVGHNVTVVDDLSGGKFSNISKLVESRVVNFIQQDITSIDNESWASILDACDYVFHLAGKADIVPSIEYPDVYYQTNVTGTYRLLMACTKIKLKKFVYAASSSCYGIPERYPTCEKQPLAPQYPYALTKMMGEELVIHWSKIYKLPAVSLRLFNVYGPRARTTGAYGAVFGVFLAQKLANSPFTIVGDGTQTRDFTYVSDVVTAFYSAAISEVSSDIFNVGSGKTSSVNEVVKLLEGDKTYIPKRPGEPDCTFADISKIQNILNWSPQTSLKQGVGLILEHIDDWSDAPVWDPKSIEKATQSWFKCLSEEQNCVSKS